MNELGFLTINSQPAVNGARSDDKIFGWGPSNGFVYQKVPYHVSSLDGQRLISFLKAYLEFFVQPELLSLLLKHIERDNSITYYVINKQGDLRTNTHSEGPNAVTWGVFPGKEIIQPTIVEAVSFMAWKVCLLYLFATEAQLRCMMCRTRHTNLANNGRKSMSQLRPLGNLSPSLWRHLCSSTSSTTISRTQRQYSSLSLRQARNLLPVQHPLQLSPMDMPNRIRNSKYSLRTSVCRCIIYVLFFLLGFNPRCFCILLVLGSFAHNPQSDSPPLLALSFGCIQLHLFHIYTLY
jgi:hypothetical protein